MAKHLFYNKSYILLLLSSVIASALIHIDIENNPRVPYDPFWSTMIGTSILVIELAVALFVIGYGMLFFYGILFNRIIYHKTEAIIDNRKMRRLANYFAPIVIITLGIYIILFTKFYSTAMIGFTTAISLFIFCYISGKHSKNTIEGLIWGLISFLITLMEMTAIALKGYNMG